MLDRELQSLLEGTADAAFAVDAQGITRSWNRAAETLLQIPARDAIGQPCAQLIGASGAIDTLVCGQNCQVLQNVAAQREIPNFDMRVNTCFGTRRWVNVSILQVYDPRSRSRLAVHLMRDIEGRKKTEQLARTLLDSAKQLVALSTDPAPPEPAPTLTDQETRLLRGLATGRSPAEVAQDLGITGHTLRNHLYHINRKLKTRNRLQAIVYATRHALI